MTKYNTNGFVFLPDVSDAICASLANGIFGDAAPHLKDSGKGITKLLSNDYKKCNMNYPQLDQGNVGSCVAVAVGGGVDQVKITEIANGERSEFKALTCSEAIYYGARVVMGQNRIRGDGASTALAIKYIAERGTIARGKYGNIDISEYSVDRCRKWGQNSGFPKSLEDISKEHKIEQYSRVTSYEMIRDSIANNCPVIVGSSLGFSNTCNNDGIAKQNTTWQHCYHPDSWILAADYKLIKNLTCDDMIYNQNGNLSSINKITKRYYNGKMITVSCRGGRHRVTSDHVFLVQSAGSKLVSRPFIAQKDGYKYQSEEVLLNLMTLDVEKKNELIFVHAKDLRNDDLLVCPRIKFVNYENIPQPECGSKNSKNKLPILTPSDDLAWFFGLYAGDGYSVSNHKIGIILNKDHKDKIKKLVDIISNVFGLKANVHIRTDANAVNVIIYNAKLANYMKKWFDMKKNKQFPSWVFNMKNHFKSLIDGFCAADGCIRPRKNEDLFYQMSNTSEKLMNQIYIILISMGLSPNWRESFSNTGYKPDSVNYFVDCNMSKVSNTDYELQKIKSISEEEYIGEVISLEVDNDHTYVCGNSTSHNCMRMIGIRADKELVLIDNTWGPNWNTMPIRKFNEPKGSFWCTAEDADRMAKADAWSISAHQGYPLKINSEVVW